MKKHSVPLVLAALAALPGCSQRDENASGAGSESASDAPPAAWESLVLTGKARAAIRRAGVRFGVSTHDEGRRTASMPEGRYPTKMQAFDWMKPAAAAALFTYLRSSFDNAAPAVDASAVAKALESP